MASFESVHGEAVRGRLVMFDRMLFRGYLPLWNGAAFERYLTAPPTWIRTFSLGLLDERCVARRSLANGPAPSSLLALAENPFAILRSFRVNGAIRRSDCQLFQAVLQGERLIRGFRNRDLASALDGKRHIDPESRRRRSARLSRLIAKLRGHDLIAKVPRSLRYRVTERGLRLMALAVRLRTRELPAAWATGAPNSLAAATG